MRAHSNEHTDCLPVIDISSLRHVAYVFDALIYYMRSGTDTDTDVLRDGISVISWQDHDENENDDHDDEGNNAMSMDTESIDGDSEMGGKVGRKHPFFQRSDSTLCLGCPPPDPFHTPLVEAIPLADQPHLLQPNARREDLFGVAKQTVVPTAVTDIKPTAGMENALDKLPVHLSLSVRMPESPAGLVPVLPPDVVPPTSVSTETPATSSTASVIVRPASFQPTGLNQNLPVAPGTSGSSVAFETPAVPGTSQYPMGPYDTPVGFLPPRYIQPNIISITLPPTTLVKADIHQPSVIVHSSTAISSANVSAANLPSANSQAVTSVTSASGFMAASVLRLDSSIVHSVGEPTSSVPPSVASIIIHPSSVAWSVTPSVVTMVPGPLLSSTPAGGQGEGHRVISQSETPVLSTSHSANSVVMRPFESCQPGSSLGKKIYLNFALLNFNSFTYRALENMKRYLNNHMKIYIRKFLEHLLSETRHHYVRSHFIG